MKIYRYLTGSDNDAFCHRVTEALNNGYELHGAPTLTYDSAKGTALCGQAVTKEVPGKDYEAGMSFKGL